MGGGVDESTVRASWFLHVRDILFSLRCLATEKKTNVRVVARIHVLQRGIVHFWTLRRAK
jgi:hypothetical protein